MTKLVEAAERRAILRCPEYDESNTYWKKVDDLLAEQDMLMNKIRSFNNEITILKPSSFAVSDFLINPSPSKNGKHQLWKATIQWMTVMMYLKAAHQLQR